MMSLNTTTTAPLSNEQEEALLQRIAEKHRASFETLYTVYQPRIFKFVFRLTRSYNAADELTNDVLLTIWQNADSFRAESKVSTWIFGIAYRQSLRHLRKRKMKLVPVMDRDMQVDDTASNFEREDWVQQGIHQLPPKQRLAVMLVYYLGLSCEETAAVTASPISTVKTRMFHARRKLKAHLAKTAAPRAPSKDEEND